MTYQKSEHTFHNRFGEFYEGETVRYSVFPLGENIRGAAYKEKIMTIDPEFVDYCKREGISTYCEWEAAHDVRKESEPCLE